MKILIIDFQTILNEINDDRLSTKTFEIYYDITRLLEIEISKEACFKLFTKYSDNYGKLKEYLSIMKKDTDRKKFDEEFTRRYKQLYFNQDQKKLEQIKNQLQRILAEYSSTYIIGLIAIGNIDFMKIVLNYFDIAKYINSAKFSEYLNMYPVCLNEILEENIIEEYAPEKVVFALTKYQDDIKEYILSQETYTKYPLQFVDNLKTTDI